MKTHLIPLAGLAIASVAFGKVDTTQPMVTGQGNATVRPARVMVTNGTADAAGTSASADKLDKFIVTGSLLPKDVALAADALVPAPAQSGAPAAATVALARDAAPAKK